jgi:hypothetical protein
VPSAGRSVPWAGDGYADLIPAIERIRDRRCPVIDVERGLVLGLVFFDHPGPVLNRGILGYSK